MLPWFKSWDDGFYFRQSCLTVKRVFTNRVVFLATGFNQVSLKPEKRFLIKKVPKVLWETGHEEADLVIDATEFEFQQAPNYDLSCLICSNYKNTMAALIAIAPYSMRTHFSDIYPGSLSDSEITAEANSLDYVNPERVIMSDRGFAI